jgi:hypothetical protein
MRQLTAFAAGLILLAASAAGLAGALAQDTPPATGTVIAKSYEPLPPNLAIAVVAARDTDQYARLKASIEAVLRARGYSVSDDGPLVLEFYASEVLGDRVVEKPTGALALKSVMPQPADNARIGLLSGLNQSLFGDDSGRGTVPAATPDSSGATDVQPAPRQVHLSMTLTDQRAARRLWQGTAAGDQRRPDSFAATQALVPFLVSKVGMTVSHEKFDMP